MVRNFFLTKLNKHSSKWVVLIIDLILVVLSFIFAYFIRFDATFNFDKEKLAYQIPFITIFSLTSFLAVGSYKGIIRRTGTRYAYNVLIGTLLISTITLGVVLFARIFNIFENFDA